MDLVPIEPMTRYFYSDGTRLNLSSALSNTLEQVTYLDRLALFKRPDNL
jgi:hypothetical protein